MNSTYISVIIPTFNRCEMLASALRSVDHQTFPSEQYEIIVVDNGSTDGTVQLVKHINHDNNKPIRYVYEARQGLHWARHAGAVVARGKILAYIDDDVVTDPNWLEELYKAYIFFDADCAGGKINIKWDRQPPKWVIPYEPCLGQLDYGSDSRILNSNEFINGGNFTILRRRLFEIGGFNPDQVNDRLIGDGETGLCRKIHKLGWKMVWVPKAIVSHIQFVDKNGTLEDIKRRFWNNGVGKAYDYNKSHKPSSFILSIKATYVLMKRTKEMLVGNIFRFLAKPLYYYHHVLQAAYLEGEGLYYLRLIHDVELRKVAKIENWIELI